jgi:hypothetical protein
MVESQWLRLSPPIQPVWWGGEPILEHLKILLRVLILLVLVLGLLARQVSVLLVLLVLPVEITPPGELAPVAVADGQWRRQGEVEERFAACELA